MEKDRRKHLSPERIAQAVAKRQPGRRPHNLERPQRPNRLLRHFRIQSSLTLQSAPLPSPHRHQPRRRARRPAWKNRKLQCHPRQPPSRRRKCRPHRSQLQSRPRRQAQKNRKMQCHRRQAPCWRSGWRAHRRSNKPRSLRETPRFQHQPSLTILCERGRLRHSSYRSRHEL